MSETPRDEFVSGDRAIWQSDKANTYECPTCDRPVLTQYEGTDVPAIECRGMEGHRVLWCVPGRFHEGDGACVHCGLTLPTYLTATIESEP